MKNRRTKRNSWGEKGWENWYCSQFLTINIYIIVVNIINHRLQGNLKLPKNMPFQPERSPRRSLRLQGYDYTNQGSYFVTICAHQRQSLFGQIEDGRVILTNIGELVNECWCAIPAHFGMVELDAYIVMPNHLHGIIVITENHRTTVGATHGSPLPADPHSQLPKGLQAGSLGSIIGQFKSSVSRRMKASMDVSFPLWQRNYYVGKRQRKPQQCP